MSSVRVVARWAADGGSSRSGLSSLVVLLVLGLSACGTGGASTAEGGSAVAASSPALTSVPTPEDVEAPSPRSFEGPPATSMPTVTCVSVDPTRAEVEALPDPSDALAISALSYQECIDVRPRQTECAEPTPAPTEGQGWLCATEPALTQQEVDAWNARVQEVYRQHAADQGIGVEDYRRQAEAAPAGS